MQIRRRAAFWIGALVVVASAGCGGGSETNATTTGGSSSGGAGGGMIAFEGYPATDTVTAGEVVTSPNYRMVFTFGQSTQNQGLTTSPSYGLAGGLIGATGSAK